MNVHDILPSSTSKAGRLRVVFSFTIASGKIAEIDILADPARLHELDLTVLDD